MTRLTRTRLAVTSAFVAVLALSACGGGDDDTAAADDADGRTGVETSADITISTFLFRPNPATVEGGTITVTNADNTTHTFTSGMPDAPDGVFSLELAGTDAIGSVDVEPGTYQYFCEIHTSMTGEVTVT